LIERDTENIFLTRETPDASDDDPSNHSLGSSITYRIAVGPQQGRKVFTLQTLPDAGSDNLSIREVGDRSGRVWIGTGAADAVLAFNPDNFKFEVFTVPTRGAIMRHLDVDDRNGDVWVAYGASPGVPPKILRLRLSE
jgi:streptogramin lyase